MEEKNIKINKLNINYKEFFDSKNSYNLLILHGWGGTSDSWLEFSEQLFNIGGYNIIIPDLPGFGKTKIDKIYTLDDYAELIEKFCENLKLKNLILMGHSNGGAISIKLENRQVLDFDRLILNNSAGIRNDKKRSFKRKIFNIFVNFYKKLHLPQGIRFRKLFYRFIGSHDYINSEEKPFLKETYLNMISSDLSKEIEDIKKHTLLIWGEKDTYTPLSDGNKMKQLIKNSKMIVLFDQKHGIHLRSPEILVNTFLKNI